MKKATFILILVLTIAAGANARRAVLGDTLAEEFRPEGELRLWTFMTQDSTVGRLISTVIGRTSVDGVEGLVWEERLDLDFGSVGSDFRMHFKGEHYVSRFGVYLGDNVDLEIGDQSEQLELMRQGDSLKGFITRAGKKIVQSHHYKSEGFAVDNYFLDQHELFLAMRDIRVGDTLDDTIFIPQIMLKSRILAVVEDFVYKRLYNQIYDSVFVIHYLEPQEQYSYFTSDKRLVKVVIPGSGLKAYLDVVRRADVGSAIKSPFTMNRFVTLLPTFLVYLLLGLVSLIFFIGRGYRWPVSYMGFALGGLLYSVATFTQVPLQLYLVEKVILSKIGSGGSPYFWALLPALMAGVIQELLKACLIVGFAYTANLPVRRYVIIGAVIAAGFGIVESCYLITFAGDVDLFSWHLLERGFMVLFHAASGALLGLALVYHSQNKSWIVLPILTVAINSLTRYLPVFVQQKAMSLQIMYFAIPVVVLVFLLLTLIRLKPVRPAK